MSEGPTISARFKRRPPEDVPAKPRADRVFWRGAVFGGILVGVAFIAGAALSLDISGSRVTLVPSQDPEGLVDVLFENEMSNSDLDSGDYVLSSDGLVVGIRFIWDRNELGMDEIVVTPPTGLICRPTNCTATVLEGQSGRVTLLFLGM